MKINSKRTLNLILWNSQLIFHNLKKSFYLLSWKSLSCLSFWIGNVLKWNSNIFNTPCHLNNGRSHVIFSLGFCIWKEFESLRPKCKKVKVWESPFFPSHLTFKKFRIHALSDNQSNNQSNLSIYHNISKFRIFGCYKPTTLKMNLVLEIWRG